MIRIKRDPNPPPLDVFMKPTVKVSGGGKVTRAKWEYDAAVAFFTKRRNYKNNRKRTKKTFSFRVYKNRELAKALEAVFGPKCAYCESNFAAVTPREIEHYRPKSRIDMPTGDPLEPGYYWLAGEWTNLLVSCIDCNRSRRHEVPNQSKTVRLGKRAQFPLSNEAARVRVHSVSVATEEPFRLLLDPCTDDPEEHLTFDDEGLVLPRNDAAGKPSDKGTASIGAYALQRQGLVDARKRELLDIQFSFEQLRKLGVELAAAMEDRKPKTILEAKREEISNVSNHVRERVAKGAPYLAMSRDYVRRAKAAGQFDDLMRNGIDPEDLLK